MWATRSDLPSYISKRGAMYLSGNLAFSICLEKGEDDTKSRALQTACCPPGRAVFLEACSFVCSPFPTWRGGRVRECLPDSRDCLGVGWSVNDLGSDWDQEVSEKSSQCESCPRFLRFEAFTLFLGISFVVD